MLTSSPIPKQTVGKTFFYAIIVLGVAALIQVGAVCWAFMRGSHPAPQVAQNVSVSHETPAPAQDSSRLNLNALPVIGDSSPTPGLPGPTPISMSQPALPPAQARLNELLTVARTLADRGDLSTALVRLHEALALAPEDPRVLAELAGDYDKLGSSDKATEYWQHLYSLGKNAGTYYDLANARLNPGGTGDTSASKYDNEG